MVRDMRHASDHSVATVVTRELEHVTARSSGIQTEVGGWEVPVAN